jgi:hypothetical protein
VRVWALVPKQASSQVAGTRRNEPSIRLPEDEVQRGRPVRGLWTTGVTAKTADLASKLTSRAIVARWSHQAWESESVISVPRGYGVLQSACALICSGIHDVLSAPDRIRTCDLRFRSLTSVLLTDDPQALAGKIK